MQAMQDLINLPWMPTELGSLELLVLAWLAGQVLRRVLLPLMAEFGQQPSGRDVRAALAIQHDVTRPAAGRRTIELEEA